MKELIALQKALHVPKDEEGHNYTYRTVDSILSAVKKVAKEMNFNVYIILTDDVVCVGDKNYMKSIATIYNGETSVSASSSAREPDKIGSQQLPQISGSCSTYARKKALEGLLALDDYDDPDNPLTKIKAESEEKDERFMLIENAKAAVKMATWAEAKKKAILLGMDKHSDDFLRNIINGKV
jgi:hypothetical protein